MKYSQFLEARKILASQNLKFKDVKNKSVGELNEFFGINKAIKSMVFKGAWGKKLENNKEQLASDLSTQVKRSIAKLVDAKQDINDGENSKAKNLKIEAEIVKIINGLSKKLVDLKTTELHRRLDNNKHMKEGAKDALKYAWAVMVTEVRVDILADLRKDNVITDDQIMSKMKTAMKDKKDELEDEAEEVTSDLKDEGGEDDGEIVTTDDVDQEIEDNPGYRKLASLEIPPRIK